MMSRLLPVATILSCLLLGMADPRAQTLEPRAYSNAPVGTNFLLAAYQYSEGALVFDPSLPIENANSKVDSALLGYVYTFGIAGKSAKLGAVLPYASLFADGQVSGEYRSRDTAGIADPMFYLSMNFIGAPALSAEQFVEYRQDVIIGVTMKVSAPLGEYDPDKLINIGTNRWMFEPGLGMSKAIGRWFLEASIAAAFYTDNDEFDNDKTRQQENIYSTQFHVTYNLPRKAWIAVSANYYTGGRTTIDGVLRDDLQQNWRTGFTLALPLNRRHSLKLYGSSGVSTRTGSNFDTLGLAWQYRWGRGLPRTGS